MLRLHRQDGTLSLRRIPIPRHGDRPPNRPRRRGVRPYRRQEAHRAIRPLHHDRQLQQVRLRSPCHSHGRDLSLPVRRDNRQADTLRLAQARHPDGTRPASLCTASEPRHRVRKRRAGLPRHRLPPRPNRWFPGAHSVSVHPTGRRLRRRQQHRHGSSPSVREEPCTSPIAATTALPPSPSIHPSAC